MTPPADETPPPGPPPSASLTATLVALVSSVLVDWRRAGLLILVGAAALVGLVIYEGRDRITTALEALLEPRDAAIALERVPEIARELRADLPDVRAVLVWRVNAEANRRALVGVDADPEVTATLQPVLGRLRLGVPLLRVQSGDDVADVNGLVLAALNGVVPCGAPGWPAWNRETPPPFAIGAVCLAGIPPEPGTFVGLLEVVFARAPDPAMLDALRPVLWHAAARLAGGDGG